MVAVAAYPTSADTGALSTLEISAQASLQVDKEVTSRPLVLKYVLHPMVKCDQYRVVYSTVLTFSTPLIVLELAIRALGMIFLSPMSCAGDKASKFYKREFVDVTMNLITGAFAAPFGILNAVVGLCYYAIDAVNATCFKKEGYYHTAKRHGFMDPVSGARIKKPIGPNGIGYQGTSGTVV